VARIKTLGLFLSIITIIFGCQTIDPASEIDPDFVDVTKEGSGRYAVMYAEPTFDELMENRKIVEVVIRGFGVAAQLADPEMAKPEDMLLVVISDKELAMFFFECDRETYDLLNSGQCSTDEFMSKLKLSHSESPVGN
jgi:hypothetical protein